MKKLLTNLPLSKALHTFGIQFLNSNHDSKTSFCRCQCLLIQPSFVYFSETSFSKQCIRFETLGGCFQIRDHVGSFESKCLKGGITLTFLGLAVSTEKDFCLLFNIYSSLSNHVNDEVSCKL